MNRKQFGSKRIALATGAIALGFALAIPLAQRAEARVASAPPPAATSGPYAFTDVQIPFTDSPTRAMRPDAFMPKAPGRKRGISWQQKGAKGMEP